jgi:hypothetical protein
LHYLPSFALNEMNVDVFTNIDCQSGLFFQRRQNDPDHMFYVGNMDNEKGWLFSEHWTDDFSPDQICARGEIVYLLDHRDAPNAPFFSSQNNCWAFSPDPNNHAHYKKVGEFRINGWIRAVDPFYPRFFCDSYGGGPFPSAPFLFDARTHENIGRLPDGKVILFLGSDWLGSRLTP